MKRYLIIGLFSLCSLPLSAQVMDSLMFNRNIFEILNTTGFYGNRVTLVQLSQLRSAVENQAVLNSAKKIQGYRIRIFSSSAQTARSIAQATKGEFESIYPGIPAYPTFESPDYRVLVGNFRTKSEAMRFHKELITRSQYRGAVIVSGPIEFPAL